MLSFLLSVPSLISGLFGTLNGITNAISNEKIALLTATTQQEQIAGNERIATLQQRRDVLIAEAGSSRLNIYVRAGLALGPLVILLKLFVWDKVIGSLVGCSQAPAGTCGKFTTDPLDAHQWQVVMIVIGFYFLYEGGTSIARTFASRTK